MPRNIPQESTTCLAPDDFTPGKVCGTSPTVANSLCSRHNRRLQRNGTLERTRRPPAANPDDRNRRRSSEGTCKHEDGCPSPSYADGWCGMHYGRVYRTGDPGPVGPLREVRKRDRCCHPDKCPRPGNGGDGWCRMHKRRIDRTGSPGPVGRITHTWDNRVRSANLPSDTEKYEAAS